MYTRDEAARIRQSFWTTLGQYLAPIPSASGQPVNWINYRTGVKELYFRLEAQQGEAFVGIVLAQRDLDTQGLLYAQFEELANYLHSTLGETWQWELYGQDDSGRTRSRIFTTLPEVSVFNQSDWPRLISFFKPRLLALDEFWSVTQPFFQQLV